MTAHVSLTRPGSEIHDYEALATKLAAIPGVRSVTPAVYQTVLLSFGGQARGVVAKGVEPERERRGDEALQKIVAGKLDFSPDADGIEALLVGKQLADDWKIEPGDYVTLTSPQGRLTPFGLMPRTRRFRVAGIFDSGFYDYDENWCFMTLQAAQALAGSSDIVNALEFRLNNPERAARSCANGGANRRAGLFGYHLDGTKLRAVPCTALGKTGYCHFHRADNVCCRIEHSCGALHDGDG